MSLFWKNIFLLLGTIIGAGIFSLPIALSQAGWFYFILIISVFTFLLAEVNNLYREIIDHTKEKHQLPGYARIILGPKMAKLASFLLLFSTFGALLAYLIIGGSFVGNVFQVSPQTGSLLFYSAIVILMFSAGKKIEMFDIVLTFLKVIMLFTIISIGFLEQGISTMKATTGSNPLVAYGAILFALTGVSIVPELKKDKRISASIYTAQGIVLVCYILFSVALLSYVNDGVFMVKNRLFDVVGMFTILSPYLMLSWVGNDLLTKDLRMSKRNALWTVLSVPLILFLFGMQSFMSVISLTGGVFLGGIIVLITYMYQKQFPHKHQLLIRVIQTVFIVGVIVEVMNFLRG